MRCCLIISDPCLRRDLSRDAISSDWRHTTKFTLEQNAPFSRSQAQPEQSSWWLKRRQDLQRLFLPQLCFKRRPQHLSHLLRWCQVVESGGQDPFGGTAPLQDMMKHASSHAIVHVLRCHRDGRFEMVNLGVRVSVGRVGYTIQQLQQLASICRLSISTHGGGSVMTQRPSCSLHCCKRPPTNLNVGGILLEFHRRITRLVKVHAALEERKKGNERHDGRAQVLSPE